MGKRGLDTNDDSASADETMESPTKKIALSPSTTAPALLATLPSAVISHVWSFAEQLKVGDKVCSNANDRLLQYSLYRLRQVCPAWNEIAKQMLQERLGNVAVLDVAVAAKSHSADATAKLVVPFPDPERIAAITDVRIAMGDTFTTENYNDSSGWSENEQAFVTMRVERHPSLRKHIPDIDWEATLAPVAANVTRLDLTRMLIFNKNLGEVLRAAGKLCPNIKAVLLPLLENKRYRDEEVRLDNLKALSEAMKQWHEANGGLRHLHVPYLGMNTDVVTQFIKDVTAYCPDIEYFDGYKPTFIEQCGLEFVTCDLYLPVGLVEWIQFWKTCRKLREFNTVVLPFADLYDAVLGGLEPMEQLEELTISHSTLMHRSQEGITGDVFDKLIPKFPALKKLRIVFGDEQDDLHWSVGETFENHFLQVVGENCPQLEELKVRSFRFVDMNAGGLRPLLASGTLRKVSIGLVGFLDGHELGLLWRELIHDKRSLRLSIQSENVENSMWSLLSTMKEYKPEDLHGVHLSLSLRGDERFGYVPGELDEENCKLHTEEDVKALYEEVKRIHGDAVRVHMHITQPNDPDSGERVQMDSLELSINDPQGFYCRLEKEVQIANECVEQELCGDDISVDGVYVRDPAGALEDLEMANYWKNKRIRQFRITGLMSDDEFGEDSEFGGSDDDGAIFFDDGEGDEEFNEDEDGEEDDDDGEYGDEDDEEE